MADLTQGRLETAAPIEKPPASTLGVIGWLRANLFNSIFNTILTLLALYAIVRIVPALFSWAVLHADVSATSGQECRAGEGACWAFIREKARFIIFGRFPYAEQWRPLVVVMIFVALLLGSCDRRFWSRWLAAAWVVGIALVFLLMFGGVFGMTYVDTSLWNGLPLTLILAVFGMAFGFPLAIVLALGRRSEMPAIRSLCVGYIELIRGVPLITVLFMASVMLPLFLPGGVNFDKLLRAQIAFILFAAAYLAEIIRGGLQAVPKGQYEAADALGLSYAQKMRGIILPQAISMVIPPLANTFIGFFKDTSLVVIIGLFDVLNTANAALTDPNWRGFAVETYLFAALIYFTFCFFMSKYSQYLERELNKSRRR